MSSFAATQSSVLLANFKKSIELWFLKRKNIKVDWTEKWVDEASSFQQIQETSLEILQHGLRLRSATNQPSLKLALSTERQHENSPDCTDNSDALNKLIEDFEWVRRSAQLRNSLTDAWTAGKFSSSPVVPPSNSVTQFLRAWILHNLKANCLCACLQALVADKELLQGYYQDEAFLRNDDYATALFICLSSLEMNQCALLSQIDANLCHPSVITTKHRRSSSHPNFSVSPPKRRPPVFRVSQPVRATSCVDGKTHKKPTIQCFRKTKSFPLLSNIPDACLTAAIPEARSRSKTISSPRSQPRSIPPVPKVPINDAISNLAYSDEDLQPSTSASSSKKSQISSNSSSASVESTPPQAQRIELVKCDDIKIWTDPTWEQQQQQQTPKAEQLGIQSYSIPQSAFKAKQATSVSPINSFLNNIFGTPPTYTTWSLHESDSASDNAELTRAKTPVYPCRAPQLEAGGLFDSFLPVDGQKLRARKSQRMFEDGISSLDYMTPVTCDSSTNTRDEPARDCNETLPRNRQSLVAFLEMAQLSRNNTELEKENAHFRISEAIISAIEHIKWAKLEPDKTLEDETLTATDWLENDYKHKTLHNATKTELPANEFNEHIPYAELDENGLDVLSAEVVGLTLISKFNDKHLPKVSELKWLVSDEDTPQSLLPMPDVTSSANPDDHIMPSMTRGTRYWAPPRPQIIFTDHPPPNRRQLIKKQNNRCAGCGMRVSAQYIHSFRYCTYLGKYHCTGCHRNQISATPAKILHMWDFKCYPVSVFAYHLLEQMYAYPLFYVPDLNPALYVNQKALLVARNKRIELCFVKEFIKTCRFAIREAQHFCSIPEHITEDADVWSMADFFDVSNKSMERSIDELIAKCESHIFNCVLCTARGFICDICRNEQIIYPWQRTVFRCERCGACLHLNCWKRMHETCSRCQRISRRQKEF